MSNGLQIRRDGSLISTTRRAAVCREHAGNLRVLKYDHDWINVQNVGIMHLKSLGYI